MRDNVVYNQPDNEVMVRTNGNHIYIICRREEHVDSVVEKLTTETCHLTEYGEWDEGKDMRWILTFKVLDDYELHPTYN